MAILCEEYDLLFTHVPRTGGVFVEEMLVEHLDGRRIGGRHASVRWLGLDPLPAVRVMTVRDPVSWHRSYWAFARAHIRRANGWPIWDVGKGHHPTTVLDETGGGPTFESYAQKVLDEFPNGFVRSMFCGFMNGCTHALRTEALPQDLEQLLRTVGFDRPSLVRERVRTNKSPDVWMARATLEEETEARLGEVDTLEGLRFPFVSG